MPGDNAMAVLPVAGYKADNVAAGPRAGTDYLWLIRACVAGIIAANVWAFLMTATGMAMTHAMPPLLLFEWYLPQNSTAFVFSAVMQAGIATLYFSLAYVGKEHHPRIAGFLLGLIAVAWFFAAISVHAHVRGQQYKDALGTRMQALASRIEAEKKYFSDTLTQVVQGHKKMANDAERGDDRSGIAKRGPIWRERMMRAEHIAEKYAHLAAPARTDNLGKQDEQGRWNALSGSFNEYVNRAVAFLEFVRIERLALQYEPDKSLEKEFIELKAIMDGGHNDIVSLTLSAFEWREIRTWLSLLIAIVPDIVSFGLAYVLMALRERRILSVAGREPVSLPVSASGWGSGQPEARVKTGTNREERI